MDVEGRKTHSNHFSWVIFHKLAEATQEERKRGSQLLTLTWGEKSTPPPVWEVWGAPAAIAGPGPPGGQTHIPLFGDGHCFI